MIMPDLLGEIVGFLDSFGLADEVSTTLVGYDSSKTWVRVIESPGTVVIQGLLEAPSFDFNVYAPTLEEARGLCMDVKAALESMVGYWNSSMVITKVEITTTPYNLTDLLNNQPRYVFTGTVFYRAKG